MAISITQLSSVITWEIPLMYGDISPDDINDWNDNSWIVEHLRNLANKIELENPRIISIGLNVNCKYKSPQLVLELFER